MKNEKVRKIQEKRKAKEMKRNNKDGVTWTGQ